MTGLEKLRAICGLYYLMGGGVQPVAIGKLKEIADQIERETLPRPLFEDWTPVKSGDIVLVDGEEAQVNGFYVNYNGSFGLDAYVFESGMTIGKGYGSGERVKRPEPPDTWERIEADVDSGDGYAGMDASEVAADVLRRCKALAGVE